MGQGPFPHAIYQVARYETLQSPQHLRWVGEGQVYYISIFQARTWVLSVFFEMEHQGIGTHRSLGGVSCDLNPAAPGLLAKLQLCYSQFRRGHHHSLPTLSTPSRASSAGVSRSLALLHPLKLIMVSLTYVSC